MQFPQEFELLSKRCIRGCIIFKIIWLLSLGACAFFLLSANTRPWSAVAFVIGVFSSIGLTYVRNRYEVLKRILENLVSVYWAQPQTITNLITIKILAGKKPFRLHLSDGEYLDMEMPENEIPHFKEWLNQSNPQCHWGTTYEEMVIAKVRSAKV